MTTPLAPDSPRRQAARRFGTELRRAMTTRGATIRGTATDIGVSRTLLHFYRDGVNMPRLETAQRLADALSWPALVAIAMDARTGKCERCARSFPAQGSGNKRYCSEDCRRLAWAARSSAPTRERAIEAERRASRYAAAIESFCRSCEPEGLCRTADCELRRVSPLPMARGRVA